MEESESAMHNLSVSIVVYNSDLPLLDATFVSLGVAAAQSYRDIGLITYLTVIDNNSEPAYQEQLKNLVNALRPTRGFSVELLQLDTNLGFGPGHNRIIVSLTSDFHLVLNPDVEMAANALTAGIKRLQDDTGIALVSPRAVGATGQQEFLCKRYPSVLVLALRAFAPVFVRQWFHRRLDYYELRDRCHTNAEASVPLASGCFMLVRRADLQAVGGFDDAYFLYFEDFDLSIRIREHGTLLYCPEVEVVHHGGYAGSKGLRHLKYFFRSALQFFRHHGWRWI